MHFNFLCPDCLTKEIKNKKEEKEKEGGEKVKSGKEKQNRSGKGEKGRRWQKWGKAIKDGEGDEKGDGERKSKREEKEKIRVKRKEEEEDKKEKGGREKRVEGRGKKRERKRRKILSCALKNTLHSFDWPKLCSMKKTFLTSQRMSSVSFCHFNIRLNLDALSRDLFKIIQNILTIQIVILDQSGKPV